MTDSVYYLAYYQASLLTTTEAEICILGIQIQLSPIGLPSHTKVYRGIGHRSGASLDGNCAAASQKNSDALLLLNKMILILVGIIILKTNHTENTLRNGSSTFIS